LKSEIVGQNLKIVWDIKTIKFIDYIELNEVIGDNLKILKKYSVKSETEYEYNSVIPIFEKKLYSLNVVYKNGEKGKIHIIEAFSKNKNIVIDSIMGEKVHIYLPENYNRNNSKVVYILGSNSVFDSNNGEIWEIENLIEELKKNKKIEDMVVVSVIQENEKEKYKKYIPYIDNSVIKKYGIENSKSEEYYNFIKNKFIPAFERKYFNLSKNKDERMLIGYKEGGLFSLWIGLSNQTFGQIAVISPILWPERNKILFEYNKKTKCEQKIWIENDTKEFNFFLERRLLDIMINSGYNYGENLFYMEDKKMKLKDRLISPFLIFNNQKIEKLKEIEINFEIIKNSKKNDFFINLIAIYENGIKYLVYKDAEYNIFNTSAAYIDFEGNFKFLKKEDIILMVNYKNLSKKITIKYDALKKYLEENGE